MDAGSEHLATTYSLLNEALAVSHIRRAQRLAILTASIMILFQIFRWPLTNLLSIFIEPLLETCVSVALVGITIFVAVQWIRLRKRVRHSYVPLAVCLATWLIVFLVPFNTLYLETNFHLLRSRRVEATKVILTTKYYSDRIGEGHTAFLELPSQYAELAADGRIIVDRRDGKDLILFPTFLGILESFSGYVYSPSDMPPQKDEFGGDGLEIKRVAPNWFWYAS